MFVFDPKNFSKDSKEYNANHASQFSLLLNQRRVGAIAEKQIVDRFGMAMNSQDRELAEGFALEGNAGKPGLDFWRETDRTTLRVRDNDQGREFLTDLMGIATPLNIGKTSRAYAVGTDLDQSVQRSMDFQVPFGQDHSEIQYDSDPIPAFTAGYGVNFRKAQGGLSEGIDYATEAQALKMKWVMSNVADYMLNGDASIKADGATGQGIKNHRNTKKINLGAAGFNIDLTADATTNDNIVKFWQRDFIKQLDDNYLDKVDVVWVSPEMMRRLSLVYSASGGFKEGTLMDYVLRYTMGRVGEFRQTFKLSGNEFFCYRRSQDYITPLVGAALSVVPVPRNMPIENYNFMIYGAMGLQVKADVNGRGGVFYAGNLG